MENDLREINIAKNKEFNRIVKIYLMISIGVTVMAFFVVKPMEALANKDKTIIFWFISLIITIWLLWWTFSGGECTKCSARKHEKRLSTDLVSSTYLGTKVRKENNKLRTYAVYDRTYDYHSICRYCDYEWYGTYTIKEEEAL